MGSRKGGFQKPMEKWNVLRGFIAKEHDEITKKYLGEGSSGRKTETAQIITSTLETVWKAMDEIDKKEKEEKEKTNEPTDSQR